MIIQEMKDINNFIEIKNDECSFISLNKDIRKIQYRIIEETSNIQSCDLHKLAFSKQVLENEKYLSELENNYAFTLYIIFVYFYCTNIVIYEEVLRKILLCENKYCVKHNFVSRVIKKAINEINSKTNLLITIKNIFDNTTKVVAWEFVIELKHKDSKYG